MPKIEDEEMQAAQQAYEAYYRVDTEQPMWNEIDEEEQENWRRAAIAVIEFIDTRDLRKN
jgi:hypothetical protein